MASSEIYVDIVVSTEAFITALDDVMRELGRARLEMSYTAPPPPPRHERCAYCGSEWHADRRGNCGACGAPRKKDLTPPASFPTDRPAPLRHPVTITTDPGHAIK